MSQTEVSIADGSGDQADDDRALGIDETGGRRNGDQAGDDARDSIPINETFFFSMTSISFQVRGTGGGSQDGVEQGHSPSDSLAAPAEAGVEADPADQQQGGADHGQDGVVSH